VGHKERKVMTFEEFLDIFLPLAGGMLKEKFNGNGGVF
jgi:hypothetical protein